MSLHGTEGLNADPVLSRAGLRRSALSGTAWTALGFALAQGGRLFSNIILAALLFQEAFALMAIVGAIIQGLAMCSDLGLGQTVVQNRRGDQREFLDTVWTLQIVRGVVLAVLAAAVSWPVASFYAANDPVALELRWLLPLVALGLVIEGFQSTKTKTAARHMDLKRVTAIDLGAQLCGVVVMVGVAWWTRSVYALALGSLVTITVNCLLSHWLLLGPANRLRWDGPSVSEIVHFGKWVFLSTVIFFLSQQIDKLAFAKLLPLDQVGVYAIAANIAILVPMLMGRMQHSVAFPLYSRLLDRQESLATVVERSKLPMLGLGAYLVAGTIACAPQFFAIAYDERYADAGRYVPIMMVGAWLAIVEGMYGAAFLASGRAHWVAAASATKLLVFCGLLWPAIRAGGLIGALYALVAAEFLRFFVVALLGWRLGLRNFVPELWFTVHTLGAGFGVLWLGDWLWPTDLPPRSAAGMALLLVQGLLVTAAFAPVLWRVMQMVRAARA
ncbi:MAG: lipopolysaccharide biosynthesis protein [Caldimonas sp.]|uniref:oligosaccharide flippase family protein n=1 Tax=Caldimonas taiwanensis TaxID=307483 RepID=UPI000782282F|nr:oligosaccharide flippase family protein [Caldimonas taiwanensis]GIX23370.1 MAG: lipopolysaccharide biosynthesis protein [Caldimonas sp.]